MRYTIEGFSQARLVELGCDTEDAILLRWFVDFAHTGKMIQNLEGEAVRYWLDHATVFEQLPILGINQAKTIGRRLTRMVEVGVLTTTTIQTRSGKRSFYGFGPAYESLISAPEAKGLSSPIAKGLETPLDSSSKDSSRTSLVAADAVQEPEPDQVPKNWGRNLVAEVNLEACWTEPLAFTRGLSEALNARRKQVGLDGLRSWAVETAEELAGEGAGLFLYRLRHEVHLYELTAAHRARFPRWTEAIHLPGPGERAGPADVLALRVGSAA